jgi:cytochrome c553
MKRIGIALLLGLTSSLALAEPASLRAGGGAVLVQPDAVTAGEYMRAQQLELPADAAQTWLAECGRCHLAYPPGLLPAKAWERHMNTLNHHYGSDASLAPAEEQAIRDFLLLVSSNNRQPLEGTVGADEQPRITATRWFKRRHHAVSPEQFARASVGGAGNCAACHRKVERGSFGKVKIPR